MKKYIGSIVTALILIGGIVMGVLSGFELNEVQKQTLVILLIVMGSSVAYCFIVGEITRNTSQMDKLWSILPIAYTWIIAGKSGMAVRPVIVAVIATAWGIRLTYNFALKGAYSIRFWEGEEDYRWAVLRKNKYLKSKWAWALFDLFFIAGYQNALVLATTLPALACMSSTAPLGAIDYIATVFAVGFLVLETVADISQWNFQQTKKKLLAEGKPLAELPAPYNKGFNTTSVWKVMRHPNYLGEQGIWNSMYFFCVGAGVVKYGMFNWSIIGGLLLILLFMGSSAFGESVSKSKYPEYAEYQKQVSKYLPFRAYKG